MSKFVEKLNAQWTQGKFVCVGLDPHPEQMPSYLFKMHKSMSFEGLYEFCRLIVEATADIALAFKPNIAFFERFGPKGLKSLKRLCTLIRAQYPGVVLILDYKRGDIEGMNVGYVDLAFKEIQADAVTISPYLGQVACQPFLDQADRGIIVLCKTSNKGSEEFQDLRTISYEKLTPPKMQEIDYKDSGALERLRSDFQHLSYWRDRVIANAKPLYQCVAYNVAHDWNANGNCGLVVGATYPHDLECVRRIVDNLPILIPGIGNQLGEFEAIICADMNDRGRGMIINSSRAIIHASQNQDFAEVARAKTIELNAAINTVREKALIWHARSLMP